MVDLGSLCRGRRRCGDLVQERPAEQLSQSRMRTVGKTVVWRRGGSKAMFAEVLARRSVCQEHVLMELELNKHSIVQSLRAHFASRSSVFCAVLLRSFCSSAQNFDQALEAASFGCVCLGLGDWRCPPPPPPPTATATSPPSVIPVNN